MPTTFEAEDHVLRWPREVFRRRLAELINAQEHSTPGWGDQVELFLDDAFESNLPIDTFRGTSDAVQMNVFEVGKPTSQLPISPRRRYLVDLLQATDSFPYQVARRPYRSQKGRSGGAVTSTISTPAMIARFVGMVTDLDERGYFERTFKKDCVDDERAIDPSDHIEDEIGVVGIWPLSPDRLVEGLDTFFDVIEVLGEFVAAPQSRSLHPFGGCGWHHRDFNTQMGRDIYFWLVNRLLERTSLGLRLATSGEDRGRLVETHGDARNDLVSATVNGATEDTRGPIEHAVALFRRRGATVEDKRSACTALAGVLELRRSVLKEELYRRDEGALFQIANEFDMRHRTESQKGDYDPVFLDWIFWWYLGTIELTDRIGARQRLSEDEPPF
ncbi:hypothetical protein KG112_18215 [Nocardioides sp. zg-ZUI104]|uniref:hypothetical protein n=1 Tax=Nocardioides faecalis TaxID=2803858 RepID=UPI001BD0437C|nr:hypothetical protein [Nocardioides faecalis]MBS4754740.1 hypothetical protein [Nocardioides faecalis]